MHSFIYLSDIILFTCILPGNVLSAEDMIKHLDHTERVRAIIDYMHHVRGSNLYYFRVGVWPSTKAA